MVDTVRSIDELLALFADNTTGDISPQDLRDAVVTFAALAPSIPLNSSMTTQGLGSGTFFMMGYYDCPAADSNLTQGSPTQTYGTANASAAAHAVVVAGGAGSTNGVGLVLTVTGTSITDAGVRTTGDSEVVVEDCTAVVADQYFETTKKWLGQVVYTLTSGGGATVFSFNFNYGFASYNDVNNTDFDLRSFTFEWLAGNDDSLFNIEIIKHEETGWVYSAAAFVPGPPLVYSLITDHSTDNSLINGKHGRWKRTGVMTSVIGSTAEGLIVRVTTSSPNSIEWLNSGVGVLVTG